MLIGSSRHRMSAPKVVLKIDPSVGVHTRTKRVVVRAIFPARPVPFCAETSLDFTF